MEKVSTVASQTAPVSSLPIAGSPVPPSAESVLQKRQYRKRKPRQTPEEQARAEALEKEAIALDVEVITESAKTVLGAFDKLIVKSLFQTAFSLTKDKEFSKLTAEKAGMTKDEVETSGKLVGAVCAKYQLIGQHAELFMLAGIGAGYTIRIWLVQKELQSLRAEMIKRGIKPGEETIATN